MRKLRGVVWRKGYQFGAVQLFIRQFGIIARFTINFNRCNQGRVLKVLHYHIIDLCNLGPDAEGLSF